MDKQTITTKLDIKAGTVSLVANTPIEMKDLFTDGAPAPLYWINKNSKKLVTIGPANPPDGTTGLWVVSFVLISTSDKYDSKITYTVGGQSYDSSTGAQASGQTGKPPAPSPTPAPPTLPGGGHGKPRDYTQQAEGAHVDSPAPPPPSPTPAPASGGDASTTTKPMTDPRVLTLDQPHLFLGQGAVKLLSTANNESSYFEPQTFEFTNGTENPISVSVYIGRTWVPATK